MRYNEINRRHNDFKCTSRCFEETLAPSVDKNFEVTVSNVAKICRKLFRLLTHQRYEKNTINCKQHNNKLQEEEQKQKKAMSRAQDVFQNKL
jgi:hypothetical protein